MNTLGNIFSRAWLHATGSKNLFTTLTIDQSCHCVTAARMGVFLGGKPELDSVDVALVAGGNPIVSHLGYPYGGAPVSGFDPVKNLKKRKEQGQKLIVVDPRKTETARRADLHLQIIPGEDATLFAGLIHQLIKNNWVNQEFIDRYAINADTLKEMVADYSLEYVSDRCGVPEAQIMEAAAMFGNAKKPLAGCNTGTSMSPDSNLADFLLECMNALCAGYRLGGESVSNQALWAGTPKVADVYPPDRTWESGYQCRTQTVGQIVGELPTALMPDEILQPGEDKIRALIVYGGNPVMAMADPDKTIAAMKDLDLLVTLDHRMTETAELSDYVFSTATQYERYDINAFFESLPTTTYLQYDPPVINKPDTVMHDWEVFYEIAREMELELEFKLVLYAVDYGMLPDGRMLDMQNKPDPEMLFRWLCEERGIDFDKLKAAEYGLEPDLPPMKVAVPEEDSGARLDLCPDDVAEDIRRVRTSAISLDSYRLSVRRIVPAMNSHYRDSKAGQRTAPQNFAYMNPNDMTQEGLEDGAKIEMSTDFGTIIGTVRQDKTIRAGVISMAHCYGAPDPVKDPEGKLGGHTGRLIPLDTAHAEPINFMPHKSGFAVSIQPC